MTKELLGYEAPTTTIFVVQTRRVICTSGEFDPNNWNPGTDDWFPMS